MLVDKPKEELFSLGTDMMVPKGYIIPLAYGGIGPKIRVMKTSKKETK